MATMYKTFLNNDVITTRTLLHEAIPITGTIFSGTYNEGGSATEHNVRNYSHGMFQSVYDYPYLSSSANHILDITAGYHADSALSGATFRVDQSKKINIYNQMAQMLMGHDATGSVLKFDEDGNITDGGTKLRECIFINFARLLTKDEIKKGSFKIEFGTSFDYKTYPVTNTMFNKRVHILDSSGSDNFHQNAAAGEYGILFLSSSVAQTSAAAVHADTGITYANGGSAGLGMPCGLIFYQAGVVVLTGSTFMSRTGGEEEANNGLLRGATATYSCNGQGISGDAENIYNILTGSSITGTADFVRDRLYNLSFNNTTELNSTIYFCRVNHNEYNYSSNPTYLTASKIRVKESTLDLPTSYITTVGMYSTDRELLAVAKLSEPLKKDPNTELTLRVRLDY